MTDTQTKLYVRGVVVMMLLTMFWNVVLSIIELVRFCVEMEIQAQDIAIIGGVPIGMITLILGYAFKILIKD